MFCDACGAAMSAEQKFCAVCGKQTGVPPAAGFVAHAPGARSDGRVAQHLSILAALWIAIAALTLLGALVLLAIGLFPFGHFLPPGAMPAIASTAIHSLFLIIGGIVLLIAAVHFVAAWGLLHHAPWARILTIAFAFLRILEVPLGTALAVYTIWVLMGPTSEQEYRALASS